ncbi:MAG TPA: alpha/beta hydrolase [Acidimicrobiales bacterium]|nr:alpha/beta hydrolase [Acidimicrobiales bacterium]
MTAAPAESRVPGSDGTRLAVRRWPGDGVPFLLVHGLASNARMWDGVAARLAGRGFDVTAIDQRGHGRSDKPDSGYDFDTVVADLVAVIDALELVRPVVAGQSWGGNVVLDLAARRGDLVRGIACVDGGWIDLRRFATWDECAQAMAPPRTAGTPRAQIETFFRSRHADWPEEGVQGALANFEVRADDTVAPWLSFEHHLAILRSLWEHRAVDLYPRVQVPVLLVPCDDGTAWTDAKKSQVAAAEAELPTSKTVWFRADHDVHAQHPDEIAALFASSVDDGFWA